ncbi:glycosyltransferase family 2 protein [Vibrio campbellii]|uniref:glycosyltransferase family 2 protein n=1 Tax=Vibrio campbellii TaxID=680 RepID=UPI004057AC5F
MKENEKDVTVIIPTYNRAHILERVIESYFQSDVKEVIFINDASTDNTKDVLKLLSEKYKQVSYHTNEVNLKQAEAKNIGLKLAKTKYVYFGDDDSYLEANCIASLKKVLLSNDDVGLVAANAIYLDEDYKPILRSQKETVSFPKMTVNYTQKLSNPVDSIFCPACFIIERELANDTLFDSRSYLGNGYREETDFVIKVRRQGYKTLLHGQVAQINLPRSLSTGGAHSNPGLKYEYFCIKNTIKFLNKHFSYLRTVQDYSYFSLLLYSSLHQARNYFSKNKLLYKMYGKLIKTNGAEK